ncbi:M23 family metallopeptidase [Enterococcus sp. AZ103]|uniref:M23 family metallopeptidase n=1 Tax=Enterococcus sp. AZ103 TaxID=2774628 RepID=UPI003F683156
MLTKNKIIAVLLTLAILFLVMKPTERKINMGNLVILSAPLKGQWHTPNTPGSQIPSHGSDKFGTTYAYDFVQLDWKKLGKPAYQGGLLKYLQKGIQVEDYYCWGETIYAPCDGEIVVAKDGFPEAKRTNLRKDLSKARDNGQNFHPSRNNVQEVAGNYVIIKMAENIFVALCHLQQASIEVAVGEQIKTGEIIGKVGHSGNSFAPHLHLQVMDRLDIANAKGLPCAFDTYQVFQKGRWLRKTNGIPTKKERILFE